MSCRSPAAYALFGTLLLVIRCSADVHEFKCLAQSPYYIDKTTLLETLFFKTTTPFNYITCPARFGKTSSLLMIEYFAQIEVDKHRYPMPWNTTEAHQTFGRLRISKNRMLMEHYMGHNPVIMLNLGFDHTKDFNRTDLLTHLRIQLKHCFEKYRWLRRCRHAGGFITPYSLISEEDYDFVEGILSGTPNVTDISRSLLELSRILYGYFHGTEVIVLVDNYDGAAINTMLAPNIVASDLTRYYETVNSMLSQVFVAGRKYLKFGFMTGSSSISFYAKLATYLPTVVTHHAFLDDHRYMAFCGFHTEEVKALHFKFRSNDKQKGDAKEYYNGYTTLSKEKQLVYNPFSLTRFFMFSRQAKKYWPETQQSVIIQKLLRFKEFRQNLFKSAWSKNTDRCCFVLKKNYDQSALESLVYFLHNDKANDTVELVSHRVEHYLQIVHTFAFEQGYFMYSDAKHFYKIPNHQVKLEIKKMIEKYFQSPPTSDI